MRIRTGPMFFCRLAMALIPPTRLFGLKRILLRWSGAVIGDGVQCVSSAVFCINGSLSIGDGAWIGHEVLIVGGDAPVSIGANCDIGPRVSFVTGSHRIDADAPRVAGQGYSLPIAISSGCWIGAGAIILGGTSIGSRCIVAAGAVVKGDFPEGVLIGGVPAKILRHVLTNESMRRA